MSCRAPAHIAAVDGDAIISEPQRVGHGRIVVGGGPVVPDLRQDREPAVRRLLLIGAVQDHCGSDFMAPAEDGKNLGLQIDPDPDRALRHIAVVPDEISEFHSFADVQDRLDVAVEPTFCPGLEDLGLGQERSLLVTPVGQIFELSRDQLRPLHVVAELHQQTA